ncbi:Cobalt import ATP-binding protein CbiO [Rhodospirillaceae bacterium LM-1]|nr:Cobalt import ATP-binding protein CbiO [Rhodospirillaceae bacterium LM-1]
MILEACGLEYSYPDGTCALAGLDLQVGRAKRLAILGPNGSGKTTLFLHLNGTLKPMAGQVMLDAKAAAYDRAALTAWRRRVGLVLQDPDDQLFAPTVGEDVGYGPLQAGQSRAEALASANWAMEALRIADLASRPTHALSYGQKKRAAIAGVVAMRPEALLLDEPSAGLDAHGVSHLMALLDHLVEGGMTLVFSTHDAELALAHADQAALFHQGRVLAQGETTHLLCDEDLLKKAHLKRPWALEVGLRARQNGLIASDAPLPTNRKDALALLDRMT